MPLYEYLCSDCGVKFDALRPMKDADAPINCKGCTSVNTKRALSVFFTSSEGREITPTNSGSGCAGCAGGTCSTCGH